MSRGLSVDDDFVLGVELGTDRDRGKTGAANSKNYENLTFYNAKVIHFFI